MADGTQLNQGAGGDVIATHQIGSVKYQVVQFAGKYAAVAASSTATLTGSGAGATGDYLSGLLVIPQTINPGSVAVVDGTTTSTVFTGGAASVSNLVPFSIFLGSTSTGGPWKVQTSTSVSVWANGNFT